MPPSKRHHPWTGLPSSIDLIEMLPAWAKVIVFVLGVVFFFYSVGHYGPHLTACDLQPLED